MSPIELLLLILVFSGVAQWAGKDVNKAKLPFFIAAVLACLTLLTEASRGDHSMVPPDHDSGATLFHVLALFSAWVGAWRVITSKK